MKQKLAAGHLMALFVATVWGTAFIAVKVLLAEFHPIEVMLFRFAIAWAALFLFSPKPLVPKGLREELPFLAAGITGLTLYFILQNYALKFSYASTVGIIISAAPMFTALLLWLCRRAPRPGKAFFVGFVLSMAGITLISVAQGEALDMDFIGCGLTLGAALCWGAYGVCIELTEASGYTSLQVTRKVFFWGLLFSLPFIWLNRLDLSLDRFAKPEMLFCILYLGLGASALCFAAWNKAVVLIGSVATNVYIYLMPVITLVASALILREPVTLFSVGAIGLIVLGLWLSQRKTEAQA